MRGGSGLLTLGAALCAHGIVAGPLHAAPILGGDEEGPKVQILQPGYQDLLKGSAKIVVGIQVNRFNPDTIEMLVDDNAVLLPTKMSSTASLGFDWDTSKFTDGPHKLTVRITDTQGYRGWAEVFVYINNARKRDVVPPQLGWLSVKQGQILTGTQTIKLKAVDNFGVKWIIVSLNPESDPDAKPPLRSWLVGQKPYTFNFDTTVVQDGIYVLQAKAWDLLEQEGSAPPLYVGIANNYLSGTTMQERLDLISKNQPTSFQVPSATENTGKTTNVTVPVPTKHVEDPSAGTSAPVGDLSNSGKSYKGALDTNSEGILSKNIAEARSRTIPNRTSAPGLGERTVPATLSYPKINSGTGTTGTPKLTVPQLSGAQIRSGNAPTTVAATPKLSPVETAKVAPAENAGATAPVPSPKVRVAVNVQPDMPNVTRAEVEVPPASSSLSTPRSFELGASAPAEPKIKGEFLIADLRAGAPRSEQRNAPASLSSQKSLETSATLLAAAPKIEIEGSFESPKHVTAPAGESRLLVGEASMSANGNGAKTSIAGPIDSGKITVEGGSYAPSSPSSPDGQSRTVPGLIAKAVDGVRSLIGLGGATMSSTSGMEMGGAERLPLSIEMEGGTRGGRTSEPTTLAAPVVEKVETGPKFSENKRIAALPKTRTSRQGSISAITVSPLTVESGRTLPAFHKVEKTTTLRSVAFQYGIPVDVLAATNATKADATLAVGAKVKMPQELQISYAGKAVKGDVNSLLVGTTTMTPFRFLWEQQGGKLEWDAAKKQVVATNAEHKIVLAIGSNKAKIDDREVMMELAAFLMSGRTMVPIRVFEEGLQAQVEWDPATGRLFVAMASNPAA